MNEILDIVLRNTFSLTQFKHRIRLLKDSLVKDFFGSPGEILPFSAPDLNWLKSLPPDFYQKFSKDNVYQIFTDLEEASRKFTVLVIYLTFEPDEAVLTQIGLFSRNLFGSSLILDVKIDPNLIAGAALVWKGIYRDYSLRSRIEAKKAEISEGFKKFLR